MQQEAIQNPTFITGQFKVELILGTPHEMHTEHIESSALFLYSAVYTIQPAKIGTASIF